MKRTCSAQKDGICFFLPPDGMQLPVKSQVAEFLNDVHDFRDRLHITSDLSQLYRHYQEEKLRIQAAVGTAFRRNVSFFPSQNSVFCMKCNYI